MSKTWSNDLDLQLDVSGARVRLRLEAEHAFTTAIARLCAVLTA
jgi:hypothetical protein